MASLRPSFLRVEWQLLVTLAPLCGISLLNLYSASRVAPKGLFGQQLGFYAVGLVLFVGLLAFDYRRLSRLAWVAYFGTMGLLGAVLTVGKVVNGSKRWLALGPIGGQPSELMKLALILVYARLFSLDPMALQAQPVRYALYWHALLLFPALLILKQPDLGTALMCVIVAASILLLVPLARRVKLAVLGIDLSFAIAVFLFGLKDYQKKRLLVFLHPENDPTGTGWHARQAICAIGSGRVFGKGYLRGSQNQLQFLPEHWTDFPFAVWAEEWGLLGCLFLLALYLVLVFWSLQVARDARDRFGRYLAIGCASLLFWHVLINISMVIGMAPVVGVTLPLLSYGGSSLLVTMAALGILGSISLRRHSY